jgi:hypothetical protein
MSAYLTRRERLGYWIKSRVYRLLVLLWLALTGKIV